MSQLTREQFPYLQLPPLEIARTYVEMVNGDKSRKKIPLVALPNERIERETPPYTLEHGRCNESRYTPPVPSATIRSSQVGSSMHEIVRSKLKITFDTRCAK